MGLIAFLLEVVVVGVLVWLAVTYVPMPDAFKVALPILALVVLVLYLLLHVLGGASDVPILRLR